MDDDGRLMPISTIEVASAPVRFIRWWSETKGEQNDFLWEVKLIRPLFAVMTSSLDKQIALWDMESGACVAKYMPLGPVASLEVPGHIYPGIVYASDSS